MQNMDEEYKKMSSISLYPLNTENVENRMGFSANNSRVSPAFTSLIPG